MRLQAFVLRPLLVATAEPSRCRTLRVDVRIVFYVALKLSFTGCPEFCCSSAISFNDTVEIF